MAAKPRPCEICHELIALERLEVVPETRLCTAHAQAILKHGGEFIVTATQERLSKTSSLKQNYGGISTQKKRNTLAIEKLRREYEDASGER
jgi:hypothetical protein